MTITDAEILMLWREQVRANEGEPTIADVTQFARDLIHWHDTRQGREPMPQWCPVHEHYAWCEHNGGVMGAHGWHAPKGRK